MPSPTSLQRVREQRERQAVERLADEMVAELERTGDRSIVLRVRDVPDVDLWRKAARRAGRRLGYRTRTGVTASGMVWMADDRPGEELPLPQRRAWDRRMDEAAERMNAFWSSLMDHPPPPDR